MLVASAEPASTRDDDAIDLAQLIDRVAIGPTGEYVLIGRGATAVRLDICTGSVRDGPIILHHRLQGVAGLSPRLDTLRRLERLCRKGDNPRPAAAPDARLSRLVLALRALDARVEGASLREIGHALLSPSGGFDWPGDGESLKSRARRLVDLASALRRAGARGVLSRSV